jgi:hypothetical protein
LRVFAITHHVGEPLGPSDHWTFDRGLVFQPPDHPIFRSPDFRPTLPRSSQGLKDLHDSSQLIDPKFMFVVPSRARNLLYTIAHLPNRFLRISVAGVRENLCWPVTRHGRITGSADPAIPRSRTSPRLSVSVLKISLPLAIC